VLQAVKLIRNGSACKLYMPVRIEVHAWVPDCRCISPSPGKTTSITYSLPLKELRGDGVPIGPFFAEEFFLRAPNEDRAWSGSPMYDVNSGAATVRCDCSSATILASNVCIVREVHDGQSWQ